MEEFLNFLGQYYAGYLAGYECVARIDIPLHWYGAYDYVQGYIQGTLERVRENSGDYLTF